MNDTIDSCKCACHENKPPMNTDGLAHDRVCCDDMNGQLEWCEVKRLIAKAVVEARIDGLLMAKYGTKDNSFEEKFIDNLIQQLNTDKKIDMSSAIDNSTEQRLIIKMIATCDYCGTEFGSHRAIREHIEVCEQTPTQPSNTEDK